MTSEADHHTATSNRRKRARMPMRLPVRVRGRLPDGSVFEEFANCVDASEGGVSVSLRHPVRRGQLLHLSLPLPTRFRQYDLTDHSYRVYGLVRYVVETGDEGARVGFMFFGKIPPHGADDLPAEIFFLPGESGAQRRPEAVALTIRLAAEDAPGGVEKEEAALAECVGIWDARVKICSLPVTNGAILLVASADGTFQSRAEVRHISIGADGAPRLDLVFLDAPAPKRLQTDPEG
jgi:hypothetical protein